jgi:SAM-dependent methyltransferase
VSAARSIARRVLAPVLPDRLVGELIEQRSYEDPVLRELYGHMTDEQARLHFGPDEPLEAEYARRGIRLFHAWRVQVLRERLGDRLAPARILDVGDTDGLILRDLGKDGLGFNLSPAAVENIRANGVEAQLGDGGNLPFADAAFDVALCFETLEHVDSPPEVLTELARVTKPGGDVFVSVPWVPASRVQPRDESLQRGYGHLFELAPQDFQAMVSHTPLAVEWATICDVIGRPQTLAQRAYLTATRRSPLLAGIFRRYQFLHLRHRP